MLGIAQMFAAIKRHKKPVTTTMGVLLIIVQKLPMGAAHAQKVRQSVDKVRFILLLVVANVCDKLHFTNI